MRWRLLLVLAALAQSSAIRAQSPEDPGELSEESLDDPEGEPVPAAAEAEQPAAPSGEGEASDEPEPAEEEVSPRRPDAGARREAGVAAERAPSRPATPPRPLPTGGVSAAAAAQPEVAPADIPSERLLLDQLEARARYARAGDPTNADGELSRLFETARALGVRNVLVVSSALLYEAAQEQKLGRTDRALRLAEQAVKLSPDLTPAHWMRLALIASQDWTNAGAGLSALLELLRAKLFRFRNAVVALANALAVLGMALLAAILAYAAVQLYKYLRYPAHDFARVFSSWFGDVEALVAAVILIAVPLALGFGVVTSVALALSFVFAYQSRAERAVSAAAWVLLAAAPGLLYAFSYLVTFHGSPTDAMATAMSEAFAAQAEQDLIAYAQKEGRQDLQVAQVLGHRARLRGDLVAAESEYRRALAQSPGDSVARNNLGVLLFLQGKEELAIATFQQATANTDRAEPWLNHATLLLERAQFEEAKLAIDRARRLNPSMTEAYTAQEGNLPVAKRLLDAELGQGFLWSRLLEGDAESRLAVTEQLWQVVGGHTPLWAMPVFVLCCALLAASVRRSGQRLSLACPKCGLPAKQDAPAHYCEQCQSIFLKAIAVEPLLRLGKEDQVRSYQRRRRWTERLFALVAGGGHMFAERPVAGFVLALLFFLALAAFRFKDGLVVHPWASGVGAGAASFQGALAAAALVLLVLASVRQAFK